MKKISLGFSVFVLAVTSLALAPVATSFAADDPAIKDCAGNNTYICKTSQTNLTGGVLKNVISLLLFMAGTIAVIMIIVGAIRYITSDGDASKASQAKNTITYSVIGLVVAVMSFGIVSFVVGKL